MSLETLEAMARGGIYDQVGGGFARYAVDATWTVPALREDALRQRAAGPGVPARLAGLAATSGSGGCACETLDWALREMRGPEGGFCAALDADSEGVEGKFYVWTVAELREALGELGRVAEAAIAYFGATERGNFEGSGRNVLEARGPEPRGAARDPRGCCCAVRSERVRPGLDDKRLTSWNALMISALAEAGAVLGRVGLPRRGGRVRVVRPARPARYRRAPAAELEGRPRPARCLPRGPRVPARGADRRCTRRPAIRAGTARRSRSPTR